MSQKQRNGAQNDEERLLAGANTMLIFFSGLFSVRVWFATNTTEIALFQISSEGGGVPLYNYIDMIGDTSDFKSSTNVAEQEATQRKWEEE